MERTLTWTHYFLVSHEHTFFISHHHSPHNSHSNLQSRKAMGSIQKLGVGVSIGWFPSIILDPLPESGAQRAARLLTHSLRDFGHCILRLRLEENTTAEATVTSDWISGCIVDLWWFTMIYVPLNQIHHQTERTHPCCAWLIRPHWALRICSATWVLCAQDYSCWHSTTFVHMCAAYCAAVCPEGRKSTKPCPRSKRWKPHT